MGDRDRACLRDASHCDRLSLRRYSRPNAFEAAQEQLSAAQPHALALPDRVGNEYAAAHGSDGARRARLCASAPLSLRLSKQDTSLCKRFPPERFRTLAERGASAESDGCRHRLPYRRGSARLWSAARAETNGCPHGFVRGSSHLPSAEETARKSGTARGDAIRSIRACARHWSRLVTLSVPHLRKRMKKRPAAKCRGARSIALDVSARGGCPSRWIRTGPWRR